MALKKYNKYKPSGVEWLGEIPENWEVKKMKFIGNIYAGINGKKGDDFSKEYSDGLKSFIPFTNICNNSKIDKNQYQYVKIDEKENQNRVQKNDILFLMSSETLDDIAKNSIYLEDDKELYLNSFCKGFRISKQNVNAEFVNYLFLSKTYRNYFSLVGRGFTRINLKQEFINDAYALLPKIEEQTSIANFLNDKTTKIEQAIAIKQKQIELLKERRRILIHKAVTKGLNDTVKLKDSGVEWIGEIPVHWKIKRLKYLLEEINIRSTSGDEELLSLSKYKGLIPKSSLEERAGQANSLIGYKKVFVDNLVINKMQAVNGLISVSKIEGITSPDYSVYKSKLGNLLNINYLDSLLNQTEYLAEFKKRVTGVMEGFIRLYTDDLYDIYIHLPPIQEQKQIVEFIATTTTKIATAISLKEQEIEKLKEYKMSLIDGIVTGKVKVC